MSTVLQSTSHVHFTAFDIQSSHFGLNLYDTSLKLEQEQPELWLELAENHEIPSNATAVKMLSEEGEEKKKISSKVCGQKNKKKNMFVGYERLQMSKDWATHCLKEQMNLIQARKIS